MKKIVIIGFFLLGSWVEAKTGYEIRIDDNGYELKIKMDFSESKRLNSVVQALQNPVLIAKMSNNIESVSLQATDPGFYTSSLHIKSYGMSSELVSKCQEARTEQQWSRSCVLQTQLADGGKYMEWKKDFVRCQQTANRRVSCEFLIEGKMKDISFFRWSLMKAKTLTVKAKYESLISFFKMFYFIENGSFSVRQSKREFENSDLKKSIDDFSENAIQALKKESSYSQNYFISGDCHESFSYRC